MTSSAPKFSIPEIIKDLPERYVSSVTTVRSSGSIRNDSEFWVPVPVDTWR